MLPRLSADQRQAYDKVMDAVLNDHPLLLYIDGKGGTGKTFLLRLITAAVRAIPKIAICSVTTAKAALLCQGHICRNLCVFW